MNTLNMILVEKIIRQSKNTEFDREYLIFTENARIFMNRGYVPITVNFMTEIFRINLSHR